jgi:hypothetical protein
MRHGKSARTRDDLGRRKCQLDSGLGSFLHAPIEALFRSRPEIPAEADCLKLLFQPSKVKTVFRQDCEFWQKSSYISAWQLSHRTFFSYRTT